MAFNYTAAKATAERLLASFGQSVTLRQPGSKTGDEWAPTIGSPTNTSIIAIDLNKEIRDAAGNLIGKIKRTLFISTSAGIVPAKNDLVQIASVWHTISEVRPLAPGGIDLLYEVDLVI